MANMINESIRVFKALSDPTRLRIMLLLLKRDLCVCELTFILKMPQSRISHQLRILRDAGLAEDKRDGQWMIYGVPPAVRKNLRPLFSLFVPEGGTESQEVLEDLKNLKLCLAEEVRKARKKRAGRRLAPKTKAP